MNRLINMRTLLALCLVLVFPSFAFAEQADHAGSIEAVKKEARELLEALKSYSSEQKEEALSQDADNTGQGNR